MMRPIPATLMRGGTSRGVVFQAADLPADETAREAIFRYALGSPDPSGRQVDGLGGGNASTSKAAVVSPSGRSDCDIDYSFYQVGVTTDAVDTRGNCGNLTAAVSALAIDLGWVRAHEPTTEVRIYNTNTRRRIVATVPVRDGRVATEGDFRMSGVAHPGAPIRLLFELPGGAVTGSLLPTGNAQDSLVLAAGREIAISIVDAANPVVLVRARDVGVAGEILPPQIESDQALLDTLEWIRGEAAARIGLAPSREEAARRSPTLPFVGIVAAPQRHQLIGTDTLELDDADLLIRYLSGGSPHRALPLTAALAGAVAARIEGTVAAEVARGENGSGHTVKLAHPSGVMEVDTIVVRREEGWLAESVSATLTARTIMEGAVLVPHG